MKFVTPSAFPKYVLLSVIITIINNNDSSASPWNLPHWNFTSAFSFNCQFHSPVFHGFSDEFYEFVAYLVHFGTVYNPALLDHIVCFFVVNLRHNYIFLSRFVLIEDMIINVS